MDHLIGITAFFKAKNNKANDSVYPLGFASFLGKMFCFSSPPAAFKEEKKISDGRQRSDLSLGSFRQKSFLFSTHDQRKWVVLSVGERKSGGRPTLIANGLEECSGESISPGFPACHFYQIDMVQMVSGLTKKWDELQTLSEAGRGPVLRSMNSMLSQ